MKKRLRPNPRQLQQQAALKDVRKAANTMAHAVRLGKAQGVAEVDRGDCQHPKCQLSGRRFTITWFDAAPVGGFYRCDGKKRCALCTSELMGVIDKDGRPLQ